MARHILWYSEIYITLMVFALRHGLGALVGATSQGSSSGCLGSEFWGGSRKNITIFHMKVRFWWQ